MKVLVVSLAIVAAALCAPSVDRELAVQRALPALEQEEIHDEYGQYAFRYVTAEGTVVSQRGWLVPDGGGAYTLVSEGQYSYVGDDGELYVTKYFAGINGTHYEVNHYPIEEVTTIPDDELHEAQ